MKFLDTHFDDYIQSSTDISLHPKLQKIYSNFPQDINKLHNLIFYGPSGVGKYTQFLNAIQKYSPSELKYEKKLTVLYNKTNYCFKISDIHFEIDMASLGCNAKILWHDIYSNIIDVISSRVNKIGIIVCKNFHKIHSELLECFYSYIQQNNKSIKLTYIIVSESVSFIPDNIINNFHIISVPRPSKTQYNKILDKKLPANYNVKQIHNIKCISTKTIPFTVNIHNYVEQLHQLMMDPANIKFGQFRDIIYDIFIYDMEIGTILWMLLKKCINNNNILSNDISDVFIDTYAFLQYYNNNYRPIYHLEKYLYNLINKIHGFK
jgi:DNA polymerase III delta prime subunit|tara:strand:- start:661 stop:1623 length:963 start_codon:yes stop_codon:yes gene_type:complete